MYKRQGLRSSPWSGGDDDDDGVVFYGHNYQGISDFLLCLEQIE